MSKEDIDLSQYDLNVFKPDFTPIPNKVNWSTLFDVYEFRVFFYLQSFNPCFPSQKQISKHTGIKETKLRQTIKSLIDRGFMTRKKGKIHRHDQYYLCSKEPKIDASGRCETRVLPSRDEGLINKNNSNKNNNKNTRPSKTDTRVSFEDIEKVYQEHYPRKEQKTRGINILLKSVKNQTDLNRLDKAMQNYAKSKEGEEKRFIMLLTTFANCWKDYIEFDPKSSQGKNVGFTEGESRPERKVFNQKRKPLNEKVKSAINSKLKDMLNNNFKGF